MLQDIPHHLTKSA